MEKPRDNGKFLLMSRFPVDVEAETVTAVAARPRWMSNRGGCRAVVVARRINRGENRSFRGRFSVSRFFLQQEARGRLAFQRATTTGPKVRLNNLRSILTHAPVASGRRKALKTRAKEERVGRKEGAEREWAPSMDFLQRRASGVAYILSRWPPGTGFPGRVL